MTILDWQPIDISQKLAPHTAQPTLTEHGTYQNMTRQAYVSQITITGTAFSCHWYGIQEIYDVIVESDYVRLLSSLVLTRKSNWF